MTGDREYVQKQYDDRPLDIIAQDMLDWYLTQGCQKLGENNKEYQVNRGDFGQFYHHFHF